MALNAPFLAPRWSFRIARLGASELRVHATFVVLAAWIAIDHYGGGLEPTAPLRALLFLVAMVGSIVLHELGHALAARRFGLATREVVLTPIGGVARLEGSPASLAQEALIAVAGPLVNFALAAVAFLLLAADERFAQHRGAALAGPFLARLGWANLGLAVFNLLPAYPLDGGRVLRALLAARWDWLDATVTAATIGKGAAVVLAVVGLLFQPPLVAVAVVVFVGAHEEASYAAMLRSFEKGRPADYSAAVRAQDGA